MKIYLLQLVILMSLSLNLQAQNLSGTIRGKVTCHGKGLQGVVVTDGIDCVLTNKSGEYVLAPQRDARFVYLSVPSGYQPKTEKTIPLFHQQIEMDKQDGYNFELMKNPQNDANHLFLVQADVQVTSEDDVKAYGRFLQDIKEYVQPYSGKRDIFGIDCGDIVGDTPSLYPSYINTVSTLDFPVYRAIGNHDMTYGEYMQGCVKGEKDIIFVNVSWGVGIGIIIDGKVYTGKSGFSGEFGHVNAYDNEIICHCGKKGCLETEASGSALHRILLERIKSGESSILSTRISGEEDPITLDEIITAVNKEDLLCIEIVEEIGQKLGKQIAGLINIFNPELVIIGGTLSLTGDYITQPIKTAVRKYSLNLVNKDSAIITSKLKDKAGIVGACMLARSRMFES